MVLTDAITGTVIILLLLIPFIGEIVGSCEKLLAKRAKLSRLKLGISFLGCWSPQHHLNNVKNGLLFLLDIGSRQHKHRGNSDSFIALKLHNGQHKFALRRASGRAISGLLLGLIVAVLSIDLGVLSRIGLMASGLRSESGDLVSVLILCTTGLVYIDAFPASVHASFVEIPFLHELALCAFVFGGIRK